MATPLAPRIASVIRDAVSVEVPSHDTDLFETGLLDSLAFVSVLADLEHELGFEVPLDELDIENFRSVDRIAAFFESSQQRRNGRQ